jgi:hypothetical protein
MGEFEGICAYHSRNARVVPEFCPDLVTPWTP